MMSMRDPRHPSRITWVKCQVMLFAGPCWWGLVVAGNLAQSGKIPDWDFKHGSPGGKNSNSNHCKGRSIHPMGVSWLGCRESHCSEHPAPPASPLRSGDFSDWAVFAESSKTAASPSDVQRWCKNKPRKQVLWIKRQYQPLAGCSVLAVVYENKNSKVGGLSFLVSPSYFCWWIFLLGYHRAAHWYSWVLPRNSS